MGNEANKYGANYSENNVTNWSSNGDDCRVFPWVLEIVGVKGCGFAPAVRKSSTSK